MAGKNHLIKSFKVSEETSALFDEASKKTNLKKTDLSRLLFNRALNELNNQLQDTPKQIKSYESLSVKYIYHKDKLGVSENAEQYVLRFLKNHKWNSFLTKDRKIVENFLEDNSLLGFSGLKAVLDSKASKLGRPDIIAFKGKRVIFVEVKTGNDGLRKEQLKWIASHKWKVIVFHLDREEA